MSRSGNNQLHLLSLLHLPLSYDLSHTGQMLLTSTPSTSVGNRPCVRKVMGATPILDFFV